MLCSATIQRDVPTDHATLTMPNSRFFPEIVSEREERVNRLWRHACRKYKMSRLTAEFEGNRGMRFRQLAAGVFGGQRRKENAHPTPLPGRVPGDGVGAVAKSRAVATAESLA
jgi:hypothetical protein